MMIINEFSEEFKLKNKTTSNVKTQQVLRSLSLEGVGFCLRDGTFKSDMGIVSLHPSKGTHWVCYKNEKISDSYGCVCPMKLYKFIIKRNGYCLYSEKQIQKTNNFCGSYCFYLIYLTKLKVLILNLLF